MQYPRYLKSVTCSKVLSMGILLCYSFGAHNLEVVLRFSGKKHVPLDVEFHCKQHKSVQQIL